MLFLEHVEQKACSIRAECAALQQITASEDNACETVRRTSVPFRNITMKKLVDTISFYGSHVKLQTEMDILKAHETARH